jgi:peroxiredoxin
MKKQDLFIVLLILMNVALIIKNVALSRNIRTLKTLSSSGKIFAPHFVLVDLNREVWTIERIVNNARYTMLVFFSPQDCPSCLLESSLWESIYKSQQVAVVGIAKHVDEKELKLWAENAKITFPVLFDRDGDVTGSFQISTTPQKILMDNTGRILLTDSVRIEQSEYEEFLHLLRKTINFKSVGGELAEPHTSGLSPT